MWPPNPDLVVTALCDGASGSPSPERNSPKQSITQIPPGEVGQCGLAQPVWVYSPQEVSFAKAETRQFSVSLARKDSAHSNLAHFLASRKEEQKVAIPSNAKARLKKSFQEMDKDGDGFLSLEELRSALQVKWKWRDKEHVEKVLSKAMDRLQLDKDSVLDWNEFLDLSLEVAPSWFSRHRMLLQSLLVLLFFTVAPLVYCSFNRDEGDWSVWDALYFAAVTVTTVGYGDLGPVNDGMRVFTILYIIFGLAIVARIVDEAVTRMIAYYEDKVKQIEKSFAMTTSDPSSTTTAKRSISRSVGKFRAAMNRLCPDCIRLTPTQAARKLMLSVLCFMLPLIIGTVFFALNEDWPWLHAFYWSVVTCTTVGYGDLRLEKESSRIFSIFYVLAGFALIGAAVANVGAVRVEIAMERHERELLGRGLSLDMIADMDRDGNGVDRCEFVCAMLVQMGKVTQDDLVPLLEKFDELDADGSGVLTDEDLQILQSRRRQFLRRFRPNSKTSSPNRSSPSRSTPSPTQGCQVEDIADSSCSRTSAPSPSRCKMPSSGCRVAENTDSSARSVTASSTGKIPCGCEESELATCAASPPTTAPPRGRIAWQEDGHQAGHQAVLPPCAPAPRFSEPRLVLQE